MSTWPKPSVTTSVTPSVSCPVIATPLSLDGISVRDGQDVLIAQDDSQMIVAIDEKVVNWKPKAVSPEANDVAEPTAWGAAPASASNQTPESTTLVSRAQTLLNKLGYDVGVPDGLAGNKTLAGVKRFQQRNGLAETGEITVELVSRLEALAG